MPRLLLLLCLLLSRPLYAQAGLYDQDSTELNWKTMDNEFVQVIYPDYLKPKADEILRLVEHYSSFVGQSFGIDKPRKFTLILRPEFADPNGFVALGPRRSEWHAMGSFSPITTSLDWYQVLSIHEYRHVNQFDFYQKDSVQILNYLFGDVGINIGILLGLKPWYFEGDAVYAETQYTDAGRGRSPQFLARLKGVLLDGSPIPTYDQFLNGSYERPLPNHYVYGYVLVTEGYKRFGKDFWTKVVRDVSEFPHPWRLESAFERASGVSFRKFYEESFRKLKDEWATDLKDEWRPRDYRTETNYQEFDGTGYFVRYDLNSNHKIIRRAKGVDEVVGEIPYHPDLLRVDFSTKFAVFPEFRPDWRFGQKSTSDLSLLDLSTGRKVFITSRGRYYNPRFSANGQRILAAEFAESKLWNIVEFDLTGKKLRTLSIPGHNLMEAVDMQGDKIAVMSSDLEGRKGLILASFSNGIEKIILPHSRNSIFGLKSDSLGKLVFEAQSPGRVDIFLYTPSDDEVSRCTESPISSSMPSLAQNSLFYTSETPYGSEIKSQGLEACKIIAKDSLISSNYLGTGSSDSLTGIPPVPFSEQSKIATESPNAAETDYNRFDARAFTPHSWNFFVGRGLGLEVMTNNYLNDFGMQLAVGNEAEENVPYAYAAVDFRMFVPVFSLIASGQKRANDLPGTNLRWNWRETAYGARIALPYSYTSGLYHTSLELSYTHQYLATWDYKLDDYDLWDDRRHFQRGTGGLTLSVLKSSPYRALIPPLGFQLNAMQDEAEPEEKDLSSHTARTYAEARFYLPSFFANHGLRLGLSGERNTNGFKGYEFAPPLSSNTDYVLARGYSYHPLDRFTKWSIDYAFPLANPDLNLGSFYHLKRISMDLFYDSSRTYFLDLNAVKESAGIETYLESRFFRILPLTVGFRYIHRYLDKKDLFETFAATEIAVF